MQDTESRTSTVIKNESKDLKFVKDAYLHSEKL